MNMRSRRDMGERHAVRLASRLPEKSKDAYYSTARYTARDGLPVQSRAWPAHPRQDRGMRMGLVRLNARRLLPGGAAGAVSMPAGPQAEAVSAAAVPVLARGKTDKGRCWVYVGDDRPFGGTGGRGDV